MERQISDAAIERTSALQFLQEKDQQVRYAPAEFQALIGSYFKRVHSSLELPLSALDTPRSARCQIDIWLNEILLTFGLVCVKRRFSLGCYCVFFHCSRLKD